MAHKPLYELLDEAADCIYKEALAKAQANREVALWALDGNEEAVPDLTYWIDEYAQRLVTDLEKKAKRHRELWTIAFSTGNEEE